MNLPLRQHRYLEDLYGAGGRKLIILYGQRYTGKHSLLEAFTEKKPSVSFTASKCEGRQQRRILGERFFTEESFPGYRDIFMKMSQAAKGGSLVVSVYDFEFLIRSDSDFLTELVGFMASPEAPVRLLVILVSSSVEFVENDFVKKTGNLARAVSGFLKLPQSGFSEVGEYFPGYGSRDRISVYAVLGGRPGLYRFFDQDLTARENIEKHILDSRGALRNETELRLTRSLRETAVYSSILLSIASGDMKLNDIYETTGFSRAKISVYLENLTALEVTEKVFSEETGGMVNAKKGLYTIADPLFHFWYRFVFPHLSELSEMPADEFYERHIAADFPAFCEGAFREVVSQYVSASETIPHTPGKCGLWEGKKGRIDLLSENDDGSFLAGLTSYENPMMTRTQYDAFLATVKSAKIKVAHTVLAARDGFDNELKDLGEWENVTLLTLRDIDK